MSYACESDDLDSAILEAIEAWRRAGTTLTDDAYNDLARRILAHQLRYNIPYAAYCATSGITERSLPEWWDRIPAIPSGAFKEATLATFNPAHAALQFETSGTTRGTGGKHYMERALLYDAALLATFDRLVNRGSQIRFRYLNLVPNPAERPHSSLGYMMGTISAARGDGQTGWYLRDGDLLVEAIIASVREANAACTPVFLATTAFSLLQLCDALKERNLRCPLPPGSFVMETGGFKGRTRAVTRDDLYSAAADRLTIADSSIFAEYGMTELTSQWYDAFPKRVKHAPPWLRAYAAGPDGHRLPKYTVGALVHVDLANRSSCVAIQTEDVGAEVDGGIVVFGRDEHAPPRGCSLDAEELQAR